MTTKPKSKPLPPPEVEEIESYEHLQAEMDSYCNGVEFDGPLPTDLTDPDPFPPGDEEATTKSELHDIKNFFKV